MSPLNVVLGHGYFFDDFYEKVVAGGFTKIAESLRQFETIFLARLPYITATEVTKFTRGTRKYLDALIEKTQHFAAGKMMAYSPKVRKTSEESLQGNIAAALLGFLIIVIIIIVTGLR